MHRLTMAQPPDNPPQPRVLLMADHCNPEMASTPYFGYRIVRAIGRQIEKGARASGGARASSPAGRITLATQVRNRDAFMRARERGDLPESLEVVFIDSEYIAAPMYRLSRLLRGGANKALTLNVALNLPSYFAFEREVWKRFRGDLHGGAFDVVHRVTPLSPTLPSPMASWSPVPFIIGPVNGGLRWPRAFTAELKREREWLTFVRDAHKRFPYWKSTYRKAAAILAGFEHTRNDLPAGIDRERIFDCPDVGFDDESDRWRPRTKAAQRMTVLYAGRLVPYKCADVVVSAFAESEVLRSHRLIIVGDGPDRAMIKKIIHDHNLHDCIEVRGWVRHDEVENLMHEHEVFAFPSIRELGAGVVVEAMGAGMCPVVVDYGSPGGYVDQTRGVRLQLTDKKRLVGDLCKALERLASNPLERIGLGNAAQEYVRTRHSWDVKAKKMVQVYEWALGRRKERPDFHAPDEDSCADGASADAA